MVLRIGGLLQKTRETNISTEQSCPRFLCDTFSTPECEMVCEEGYSQTLFRQRQLSGFALIAKTATSQNGCELYATHVHDNEDSLDGLHNWTADAKDADFGGGSTRPWHESVWKRAGPASIIECVWCFQYQMVFRIGGLMQKSWETNVLTELSCPRILCDGFSTIESEIVCEEGHFWELFLYKVTFRVQSDNKNSNEPKSMWDSCKSSWRR